ncbi:MAG: SGNH/GDSL hydrolase family protein [bacterium]
MLKKSSLCCAFGVGLAFCQVLLAADLTVSPLFGDGAVIQHGQKAPLWGKAPSGQRVQVNIQDAKAEATADGKGVWKLDLPPLKAGGPFLLEIHCGQSSLKSSVLVGDVWLLTGTPDLLKHQKDIKAYESKSDDKIRLLRIPYKLSKTKLDDLQDPVKWQTVGDEPSKTKSLAVQFAKELAGKNNGIPVGVILAVSDIPNYPSFSFLDGDLIEAYTPAESLATLAWNDKLQKHFSNGTAMRHNTLRFNERLAIWKSRNSNASIPKDEKEYDVWYYEKSLEGKSMEAPPLKPSESNIQAPSTVWNGMLAPLAPYAIRGAVYAPGIGNLGNPNAVGPILTEMVKGWRAAWNNTELPFILLGPWTSPNKSDAYLAWSELAEAFNKVHDLPRTRLVPFHDLYEPMNRLSKPDLQRLGQRLAQVADELVSANKINPVPVIKSAKQQNGSMVLKMLDASTLPKEGTLVDGFTLFSPSTHWVWAKGEVTNGTIVVTHPKVPVPTAVRYAWLMDKAHMPNLVGPSGIPASVFRSDRVNYCPVLTPTIQMEWARKQSNPDDPNAPKPQTIDIMPINDPTLPWVMTIGDSIHDGYRDEVRQSLSGIANLVQLTTPENVKLALASKRPLWGIKCDELAVLHINHGLHNDFIVPRAEFEPMLDKYFAELRAAVGKGRIVWATTTPIPSYKEGESLDPNNNPGVIMINETAVKLAPKYGIEINDLYPLMAPNVDTLCINKGNVHFNGKGCKILAEAVSNAIRKALTQGNL